jgi:hypothetical protein
MQSVRGSSFLNADFGEQMVERGKASASLPAGRQENRLPFSARTEWYVRAGLLLSFAEAKESKYGQVRRDSPKESVDLWSDQQQHRSIISRISPMQGLRFFL